MNAKPDRRPVPRGFAWVGLSFAIAAGGLVAASKGVAAKPPPPNIRTEGEVRDNLKWAVRVRPVREGPSGEVNLAGIAEALDNTELTQLQQAVENKSKDDFLHAYDATMMVCHSCHQAVGKPYLQVRRPSAPEVDVIRFANETSSTE